MVCFACAAVDHLQQCLASAELVDAAFALADAGLCIHHHKLQVIVVTTR